MNTNELENENVDISISKKIMTFLFPLHVEEGFVCIWYEKCISLKAPGLPKGARGGRNQSASSPVPIAQRHHRSGSPLFFSLSGSGVHAFRSRLEVLICACEVAPSAHTQRALTHRAARAALGEDEDGAYTAAALVQTWL